MSMFLRLVKGNAANPGIDDGISIHSFLSVLSAWERGEVTRAQVIAQFNLTVADEAELDALKGWYTGSVSKREFIRVMKERLYMAEDKSYGGDGVLGMAVKNTFLNGANGTTPLSGF